MGAAWRWWKQRGKPPAPPQIPPQPHPAAVATQPAPRAAAPPKPTATTLPIFSVRYARNPNFTGRESLLEAVREALEGGEAAALTQAIVGLGGVGKTQLALEYAYRHREDYEVVWWVRSEEAARLTDDFCRLAQSLNLREKDQTDQRIVTEAVRRWLEREGGWLLVFDNVPDRTALKDCLPQGGDGHVLITSRDQQWREVAQPLPVPVWPRDESIEFLRTRTGRKDEEDEAFGELAEELGDLPLALEQAAAYIEGAGVSVGDYLQLFRTRRSELWQEESAPDEYPETVGTTWSMAFEASREEEPAAAALLDILAFLAPDDIPRDLLAKVVKDELALNRAITALRHYSLITAEGDALSIHRLVQAVTRDRLSEEEKGQWAAAAVRLLGTAFPFKEDDPATWPASGRLLPHALAAAGHAEMLDVASVESGRLLNEAGGYLRVRAEFAAAKTVCERALTIAEKTYGPDHPTVATRVNNLGAVLRAMGDLKGAREHFERALAIDEKAYGPEHPKVAIRVNNLGSVLHDMGDLTGAKECFERALAIDEKAYGQDHPDVATDVNNLGSVLYDMGDLTGAKEHYERALAIDEKVYGPEHPTVATDVTNLGSVLGAMGDLKRAREHFERALAIFRKFLGEDHPDTQTVRENLEALDKA